VGGISEVDRFWMWHGWLFMERASTMPRGIIKYKPVFTLGWQQQRAQDLEKQFAVALDVVFGIHIHPVGVANDLGVHKREIHDAQNDGN
jgi:hypothetical protein